MKVVSPYRPFAPESLSHQRLGPFDWVGALRMLAESVEQSCQCETFAITDVDTALPVPAFRYATVQRRLMPWILEVSLRYLESAAFDQDTVFISPDMLVFGDLRAYFKCDLGIIVRPYEKYRDKPLLNGLQWWAFRAKDRLAAFYRQAFERCLTLEEGYLRWGGDTKPLVDLLHPVDVGPYYRGALSVYGFDRGAVMNAGGIDEIVPSRGEARWPPLPVTDFKHLKKLHMARYFQATYGTRVLA